MVAPGFAAESLSASGMTKGQIEDVGEIVAAGDTFASKFRASVNVKGDYTSNALLTGHHASNDFIFTPVLDVGFTQPLGPKFTLDIDAKTMLGVYVNHAERDFIGYSMMATLDWHPKPNLPQLYASVEPYRYDGTDIGDMITEAFGIHVGTNWGHAFNNGHSLFFTGYTFSTYFADPSVDTRNEHRIVVGVSHEFRRDLTGTLFYAWQYSDFTHDDRRDSKNLVGLSLVYQFRQNWFGTLGAAIADNDSNVNTATYQAAWSSLGVTYQF
jgi:hypothetical protein